MLIESKKIIQEIERFSNEMESINPFIQEAFDMFKEIIEGVARENKDNVRML